MSKYTTELDFSLDTSLTIIAKSINPNSTILEFGTSTGYLTKFLNESLKCEITGIEIDPDAAKLAEAYCKKMIIANIDSCPWHHELENQKFDYIIFSDVLEHLFDPWLALKKAVTFLKSGGFVITSIPNMTHSSIIMELLNGNFHYNDVGLLDKTHIRFFTKKTIIALLESAGLAPIKWATTKVHPQNTEFKNYYEYFPTPLAESLKQIPDKHIYQYITISKKEKEIDKADEINISTQGFDRPVFSVWFFNKAGELYSNLFNLTLNDNTNFTDYSISLNLPCNISKMGINPSNQPAICELSTVYLKSKNNKILIDIKDLELHKAMQIKTEKDNSIKFISFGEAVIHFNIYLSEPTEIIDSLHFCISVNRDFSNILKETNSILSFIQPTKYNFYHDIMNNYADKLNNIQYDLNIKNAELEKIKSTAKFKIYTILTEKIRLFVKRFIDLF